MPKTKKNSRPKPTDEMTPEALIEFHRVCDVLEEEGRLDTADTALLTVYAQTWEAYQAAVAGVRKHGMVAQYSNGDKGQSAEFKTMKDLSRLLRGFLRDLDLAPGPRGKTDMEVADLEF